MRRKIRMMFFIGGALGIVLCSCAAGGLSTKRASRSYSRYMKGLLNDRLGDIEAAVGFYKQAQDLDHRAPEVYLQLGFDYVRLKRFREATAEFEKAVRWAPDNDNARYVLALLYVQANDFGKAAGQYELLLKKNLEDRAQNIQLRHILSQLYFLDRDFAAAKSHCDEILKSDPSKEGALYLLAMIASEEGRIEEAIDGFKQVIAHNPYAAQAMNSLAYLYAEEDRELVRALELAEKAVDDEPANGAYVDTLGWVYFKMGDVDKAIELLEKASKLEIDPVILNHLGEAYYKKGLLREARDSWASSLSLDPGQKELREKLKKL